MKRVIPIVSIVVFLYALFGWNPFANYRNIAGLLESDYSSFETGAKRQSNGVYHIRALTRMPNVKAEMVKWWFTDYMQTTAHYKRWHPTAHVWMDWENKRPGEIIGASHLVHEYIGDELAKLRIQFVNPALYLGDVDERTDRFILCAKVGDLEEPINFTTMCHIVRDTAFGAEMRSVFWLGHISKRKGNGNVFSPLNLVGNTHLARRIMATDQLATDLMTHAIEEMGNLSDFLPDLYAQETRLAPETD